MPYTNLLFFLLTLLIYATYIPSGEGSLALLLVSGFLLTAGLYALTWFGFRQVQRKGEGAVPSGTALEVREKRFILLSVLMYLSLVYSFGLKNIIWRIAWVKDSPFLDLCAGFLPFVIFLAIVWFNAYPAFRGYGGFAVSRKEYFSSQARLNIPALLPVFVITFFQDVLRLLPVPTHETNESFFSWDFILFPLFLVALMVIYPVVVKIIWKCHPMDPGPRRETLEGYCRKAGLKIAGIYLWPTLLGRSITAGITGLVGRLRYLFVTPELLTILGDEELESVIAHEAGHVRKRHMYYFALLLLGFPLLIFLFSDLLALMFEGFNDLFDAYLGSWYADPTVVSMAVLSLCALGMVLYLRLFFGVLSRNFERQADLFVFEVVGHPDALISSLEKIAYYGRVSRHRPNWHHFGIGQRIGFLQECAERRERIAQHHRKVRRIKCGLVILLVVAVCLLGVINHPKVRKPIELGLMEKKVRRVMEKNHQDPELKRVLADILLERKEYRQAERLYQEVVRVTPDNAKALNNLAWLYATAEDQAVRDKAMALALALEAARRDPQPHILDTLAEAYFVNGNPEKALEVIDLAIRLKPKDIEYYEKQKRKFEKGK